MLLYERPLDCLGKRRPFLIFLALLSMQGLFCACGPPEQETKERPKLRGVAVVLAEAKSRDIIFSTTKIGVLRARERFEVNFSLPGNLEAFLAEENTVVEKGAPIARLEATPFRAKLREAQIKLQELERNRRRVARFYKKRLATRAQFDEINTLFKQAREQVSALKKNLEKLTLRAPKKGILVEKKLEPGNFAPPGVAVAELVAFNPLLVDFEFSDVQRRYIPRGKKIELTCDSFPERVFYGRVLDETPDVDLLSQLSRVEVEVTNEEGLLKPGLMVKANIVTNRRRRVVTVPMDTLVYVGNTICVYEYDRERKEAQKRVVKTGSFFEKSLIIEEGIDAGESIIVSGQGFVSDGTTVRVVGREPL